GGDREHGRAGDSIHRSADRRRARGHAGSQPRRGNRGHRGGGRGPSHLAGQVLRRAGGICAGRRELLGRALGGARAGRGDRVAGARAPHFYAARVADVPAPTPVATPDAVIVATEVVAEAQVTWLVKFCVELSV